MLYDTPKTAAGNDTANTYCAIVLLVSALTNQSIHTISVEAFHFRAPMVCVTAAFSVMVLLACNAATALQMQQQGFILRPYAHAPVLVLYLVAVVSVAAGGT
jgi:hypothetical protein